MHGTDTPGSGASPPEPLRLPEPPEKVWGLWRPKGTSLYLSGWHVEGEPGERGHLSAHSDRERAQAEADTLNYVARALSRYHNEPEPADLVPAILGVSPAVVAQRDKLGKVLETALRYIEDSDLYGSEVAYGVARAALAEWRAAQEPEGKGSTADGQ
jgi:hypothetical protein